MKNVITFVLLFALLFGLCYLLGSFGQASFNITLWDSEDRQMIGSLGGFFSACFAAIGTGMLSDSEDGNTDDSIQV